MNTYMGTCTEELSPDVLRAAIEEVREQSHGRIPWITAVTIDMTTSEPTQQDLKRKPLSTQEIKAAQRLYVLINHVYLLQFHWSQGLWKTLVRDPLSVNNLLREWNKVELDKHGILRRKNSSSWQVVLPEQLILLVLNELHVEMGHLGVDRVVDLARARFYWPHMYQDIANFVKYRCRRVKQKKPNAVTRAPMTSISTSAPFELISLDFFHLGKSKGGYEYVMLTVDHFTRYTQAYATLNKTARTAAEKLFNDSIYLGFQHAFITIKVGSWKTSCSIIRRVSVESTVPERCRTARKLMARWKT